MRQLKIIILMVLCFACTSVSVQAMDVERLAIITKDGTSHVFQVEVAREDNDRQRGLMFRQVLDEDKGMLFEFDPPYVVTMWMKNTQLPLDMVFIFKDGTIAHIAERTKPFSLDVVSAGVPVSGVLEIRGGLAQKLGIAVGDKVEHGFFVTN